MMCGFLYCHAICCAMQCSAIAMQYVLCNVCHACVVLCMCYPVHALCCAMCCCAMCCCAMCCCVMRCCATRCCAMRCCAMRCCAMRCCAMRCCAMRCCAMRCCAKFHDACVVLVRLPWHNHLLLYGWSDAWLGCKCLCFCYCVR